MNSDELFNLLQAFISARQNLIKEIRSSNLKTAQLLNGNSLILEALFNDFTDLSKLIRSKTERITLAEASALGELETVKKLIGTAEEKSKTQISKIYISINPLNFVPHVMFSDR